MLFYAYITVINIVKIYSYQVFLFLTYEERLLVTNNYKTNDNKSNYQLTRI